MKPKPKPNRLSFRHGLAFFALAASVPELSAQNIEQVQPSRIDPTRWSEIGDSGISGEDLREEAYGEIREEILPELEGIALLSEPGQVKPGGLDGSGVIDRMDGGAPGFLSAAVADYLGKPLSLVRIAEIKTAIETAWLDQTGQVVRASVPEQDISSAVLQVIVTPAKVGEIRVINWRYFGAERYLDAFRLQPGDVIHQPTVSDDIDWINRQPYRDTIVVYRPGDGHGETDIEIVTSERRPWTVFAGYDNHGASLLGEHRWSAGFVHGDVFQSGSTVLYQYLSDFDLESVHAHFASVNTPLPWRHEIRLAGYYAESEADDVAGVDGLDLSGESYQTILEYVVPHPRRGDLRQETVLGFDFKSSDNNFEFGGAALFADETNLFQFRIEHRAELPDRLGVTKAVPFLAYGPGGWNSANSDAAFDGSRAGADSTYLYGGIDVDRLWTLPLGCSLETNVAGQAASANLLETEQLTLSGIGGVRGFENYLARADHGLVANVQLNLPAISLGSALKQKESFDDRFAPYAFWDYGWGRSVDRLQGEGDVSLSSLGLGLRGAINQMLSFDASYGWQVGESGFEDGEEGRFHLQATARW